MNEEVKIVAETEEFADETLVCKECGNEFVFTAGEQRFYKEKGFLNKPKSCKACRDAKKNAGRAPREYFTTVCAKCGGEAKVIFQPSEDRPVYCSACFEEMKNSQNFFSTNSEPITLWSSIPVKKFSLASSTNSFQE